MCEKVGGLPGRELRMIMLLLAGHRQGVGQDSKSSTGRFDSYGLRKRFIHIRLDKTTDERYLLRVGTIRMIH